MGRAAEYSRWGLNRNAPIIVVTLVAEKHVAMGFPIQDILSKPVRMDELLASLHAHQL